ncbi:MAG TPA: GAF domain-containing protein [Chryseosolibacter sp.]
MKRSLKRMGLYLLAAMVMILLSEYVIIRYKIERLEEVEEKKDFARSAQLSGQQIALAVQQHLNGIPNLQAEIGSRIEEQDHDLKILKEGGRIGGTHVFVGPLSKLPRISFDQLEIAWGKYKSNVMTILLDGDALPQTDSLGNIVHTPASRAKALLPAQWLTLSNWYKALEIDLTDEANARKESVENWVFAFIFFDLVLLAGLFWMFRKFVLQPLATLQHNTIHHVQKTDSPPDEIGNLTGHVNEILEQLKDATEFVGSIAQGKLDLDYKSLDSQYASGKNKLADSLIAMQQKLKEMNVADQQRNWANEGLTKFVDILRSSNDNIHTLGDKIISNLVQYTGSNQGGLYILNDEDEHNKFLELVSLFAFNTKKFEKQRIKLGEGILGQTFLEKETTLLTEIPDEYIRITSGLGEANPRALLFVPLKVDKEVYGIVELASFDSYDEHEIQFVEKLAETIASTLASVKAAQKNKQLIEQFQQQTEEMRAQEEEMRQNMEELQATQEEMARKERDYISEIQDLQTQLESSASLTGEVERLKTEHKQQEIIHAREVKELRNELAAKPAKGDEWKLAEEVEKTLRFQIDALRITENELLKSK